MDSENLHEAAQVLEEAAEKAAQTEKPSASDRLRAFEDKHLGKDIVRIDGKIERGHGSRYQKLKPEMRTSHDLLTSLVSAEDRMMTANRELQAAIQEHAEAEAKATAAGV